MSLLRFGIFALIEIRPGKNWASLGIISRHLVSDSLLTRETFRLTLMRCRSNQKLKVICKSMLRFAAGEEKKPPASAFDFPNNGDSSTPTG